MLHRLFTNATPAHAHCDLYCGVYDPAQAKIEANQAQAKQASAKMQQAIEDPLVESNWHGEVRQVIEDAARIGSGVLKGPFPIQRTQRLIQKDPVTQMTSVVRVDSTSIKQIRLFASRIHQPESPSTVRMVAPNMIIRQPLYV